MYLILQKTLKDKRIKKRNSIQKGVWIYVENPDSSDLDFLEKDLNLDASLLKDALDPYEVPRLEQENGVLYVFARVPQREDREAISTPIGIVIASEFIVTVSQKALPFFEKFDSGKIQFFTTQKTKLFIQLFAQINSLYTQILTDINRDIRKISIRPEKVRDRDIFQFVRYEETLNKFLADLVPTSILLKDLLSGKYLEMFERDKDLVEDLLLSTEQLIEQAKANLRTIVNIREAYQTVVTNNLNRVIKVLTVVTVILTIPTFIAGLWGMNVALPFQNDPNAFWYIIEITVAICTIVLLIFLKKDWF